MTQSIPLPEPLTDEQVAEVFAYRREQRLRAAWGSYAPRNPIASDMHDCERYQVMRLIAWKVRATPDLRGLQTIENGNVQEPAMIRQMQDEGWEVVELQAPFEIMQPDASGRRRRIVSGKIDGKVRLGPRELAPFDTKDTSEHVLRRVETEADLHDSPWTRKWWRQVQLYLLGEENERGFLVLGYRGDRRVVPIRLDYAEAERLLRVATWAVEMHDELEAEGVTHETVDEALRVRDVPYHHEFSTCRMCPFRDRACFPPDPGTDAAQARPDLADDVRRYLEVKPLAAEAEKLRKRIKSETEGYASTVAGDYVVEGKVRTRAMKARPAIGAHTQEFWAFDVRRVGERGGGAEERDD